MMQQAKQTYGLSRAYLWEVARAGTAQWATDMATILAQRTTLVAPVARVRAAGAWSTRKRRVRVAGAWVERAATTTPSGPVTLFTDTFTAPLANQWTVSPNGVSISGGQLLISTAGVTGGQYPAVETKAKYKLTGGAFVAKVAQILPRTGGNYETFIETGPNYNNNAGIMVDQWNFRGYITTGGTRTDYDFTVAYNTTTHAWWRIRENAGTIYFETSPNGTDWTTQKSGPHSWSSASCYLICKAGYWGTATPPAATAKWDEVTLYDLTGATPAPTVTYDSTVLADGPSFYLNTTTSDAVAGRTITRNGTLTTASLPNGDQAVRFNGTPSSYLSVASTPDVQCAPLGALTVEAWIIRYSDNGGTWEDDGTGDGLKTNIIGVNEWGSPNQIQWHWRTIRRLLANNTTVAPRAHRWSAYIFNSAGGTGTGSYLQDVTKTPNGTAFHMVAVYDDTQATRDANSGWGRVTLYVNGTQRDQDTFAAYSTRPSLVTAPLRIGSADGSLYGFDGAIGKVATYKKALSAARIAAHYTAMTGQQPPA